MIVQVGVEKAFESQLSNSFWAQLGKWLSLAVNHESFVSDRLEVSSHGSVCMNFVCDPYIN